MIGFLVQKYPQFVPILKQIGYSTPSRHLSLGRMLTLSSILHLGLPSCLFPTDFCTKPCINIFYFPYMSPARPI